MRNGMAKTTRAGTLGRREEGLGMSVSEETAPVAGDKHDLYRHRYATARRAGLTMVEAQLFADSKSDIGVLRQLAEADCDPKLIAEIVL